MKTEEKHNIYATVDSLGLSLFEKYKYLTENDKDIVKLKQQVNKIVESRNLSSVMNDTKWLELQQNIDSLPFPPAYNEKLILQEKAAFTFKDFKDPPKYQGDWSSFWEEGLPTFFTIEWLEIRATQQIHQGRLVPSKIIDATKELIQLLNKLNIPFEQDGDIITIYGYK
ncbi:DUF6678 family protein [Tenacibaculum mesophilum]|uniref:Uncharacterized protein n=1 Tax=Tenacibaculum mesophilum TaxID=104268 RepID=A0ABN5TB67_9FLAO|nr:DUF6678 family protein [Tenacibaculum mesophilum]AZJ33484.1 hypothetical protein D6200_13285 [Tenacibaculum mesophilum]QFS28724.1 hypothetical protein F9Y86_10095 [Tenacibaculum mesophilum]GFD83791.1 hypothetical protein KUL118_66530 [Tenacibaculum sp. KUL118]SHF59965.1 hypothetical protein SAMN05444344_0718 [Tenacibaculum mesophilum]